MSTDTHLTVTVKGAGDPKQITQQVHRAVRRYGRPAPARPVRVRPLWQRHDLFLEPAYSGVEPYEEEDGEDQDEA